MTDYSIDDVEVEEYVYGVAAASNRDGAEVCYVARYSGLYQSDDGGQTWRSLFDVFGLDTPPPATCVALSPAFERDRRIFAGVPGGIASSSDGGATWGIAILGSPPPFISAVAFSPNWERDGVAFAGTMDDGIYLTSDRGGRWDAWNIGLLDHDILCIAVSPAFKDDRTVYAGTESGVFYSTNGGRFWNETPFAIDHGPVLSLALSPDFVHDGILFAGTEGHGIFSSHDRGQTWQALGLPLEAGAVNGLVLDPAFPAQSSILAVADETLFISRDGGNSWSQSCSDHDEGAAVSAVAAPLGLDPGRPILAGLADGRVLRWTLDTNV